MIIYGLVELTPATFLVHPAVKLSRAYGQRVYMHVRTSIVIVSGKNKAS